MMFQPPLKPNPGLSNNKIKILIAEHFQEIQAKWVAAISSAEDIDLIGAAATGKEAVQMASFLKPDIVILALRLPELDGPRAALQITRLTGATKIILIGYGYRAKDRETAAKAGVAALLEEPVTNQDLLTTIRNIYFSRFLQPLQKPAIVFEETIYKDLAGNKGLILAIKRVVSEEFEKSVSRQNIVLTRPEKSRLFNHIFRKILRKIVGD